MLKQKKHLVFLVLVLFSISFVSAMGVTYPQPQNIELAPGQSSFFTFQIQSDDFPLTCVPIIEETQGLELAFTQEYNIEANQKYNIKPQVIIPKDTPVGAYKALFCMECSPSEEVAGSKIIPRFCNLPVTVNVVSERTRPNKFDEAENNIVIWITLLAISIVILAIVIFFLVRKRFSYSSYNSQLMQ